MLLLGMYTVTANAKTIEGWNAQCTGEIAVATAPELTVDELKANLPSDPVCNVVKLFCLLLHLEEWTNRSWLHLEANVWIR